MTGNLYTITWAEVAQWHINYDDPPARRWLPPFAICWEVVATVLVWGRLYLRIRNRSGSFGLDDAFILASWVFSLGFTVTACMIVWLYQLGRHTWDIEPDVYPQVVQTAWAAQVLFSLSTACTKLSVLLFYRRMVKNTYSKKWLYTIWILMFITAGSWVGIFVAYCLMCVPLRAYWHYLYMPAGSFTCVDGDAMTIATGVLTIASDFWSAALPCAMFQVYDLGVSKRQKIALNFIFCLGFLVTGVGIARTYYLWEVGHQEDIAWMGYDLFVSAIVECQLGLICTCAPFLRAFVRRYLPDLTVRSRHTNGTPRATKNDSVILSGARGSYLARMKPVQLTDMDSSEEEKTVLVREEGTGRLVWSGKAQRMSELLSEESVDYT